MPRLWGKGKISVGAKWGGGSQNVICDKCKMRFNVCPGMFAERLGKETNLFSEPMKIPEGTLTLTSHNGLDYLTHSCKGSVDLHTVTEEVAVLVCRKCQMRLKLPNNEIKNLDKVGSYQRQSLFAYLLKERPWETKAGSVI